MSNLTSILSELRSERNRLNAAIAAIESINSNGNSHKATASRILSPEARKRIIAAQKKRWAKFRAAKRK